MAWWWSSPPSSDTPNAGSTVHPEPEAPSKATPESQPQTSPPSNYTTNPILDPSETPRDAPLSRDDLALLELQEALAASPTTFDGTPKHIAALPPAPHDDDTFYPSTMSCRQAFDAAYACSGLSGQVRNLYRYGGMRACDDLWYAWRFCMRTKAMEKEEARHRIREWNKAKAARVKLGRNSEEVWEMRREPVELGFVRLARGERTGEEDARDEIQ